MSRSLLAAFNYITGYIMGFMVCYWIWVPNHLRWHKSKKNFNYKKRLNQNENKIKTNNVKLIKYRCMKEFHNNIKNGIYVTISAIKISEVTGCIDEISERVINELQSEYNFVQFEFYPGEFRDEYRRIKITAI